MSLYNRRKIQVKKLAVMASGRGSNFETIALNIKSRKIKHARLAALVTDNPQARAIEVAKAHGMDVFIVDGSQFKGRRAEYNQAVLVILQKISPDLIIAAGYMKILGDAIVDAFPGKIMNIHPSLLPSFPGLKAQEQAVDYGVKVSGCTVHFIDNGLDTGPIILQKAVPIAPEMTAEEVRSRILKAEHEAYSEAVHLFCQDRLNIRGRKVYILSK